MSKTFGFARVSTDKQVHLLQLDAFKQFGIKDEDIFIETVSGKSKNRPELEELKRTVRAGDKVVVWKLDRIGRSTKNLLELADFFKEKGVDFVSIKDNIDTGSAMGKFFFTIMAALAQLEADTVSERTKAGLEAARSRGRLGGRRKINKSKIKNAMELYYTKKYSISEINEMTGVKKATLYKYLKEREEKQNQLIN